MLKKLELTNRASCMSRAHPDEMTFVLLARDVAAPAAIRAWAKERIRLGKNTHGDDPQIREALECADTMERQKLAGLSGGPIIRCWKCNGTLVWERTEEGFVIYGDSCGSHERQ